MTSHETAKTMQKDRQKGDSKSLPADIFTVCFAS